MDGPRGYHHQVKLDSEKQTSYMWIQKKKKKDTNELIYRRETDPQTLKNLLLPMGTGGGGWDRWTRSLGLACAHCGIWNDWPVGTCCIAQGTLRNVLW